MRMGQMEGVEKMDFKKITSYISYFEEESPDYSCQWEQSHPMENGAFTMPYPIYEDKLHQFINDVSNSELMDYAYGDTIQEYGLEQNNELRDHIDTADLKLTKAILTCYIRQERFCDGVWGRAVKEGTFLALLKRLEMLLPPSHQ